MRPSISQFLVSRGASAPATLSAILGALLKLDYDLALGVSIIGGTAVDTLTDQTSGIVIAAAAAGNRPAYTAADAAFNNKPTMTTAVTGTKGLRSNADEGAPILASGTNPYAAWVGKLGPQSGSTNDFAWSLGSAANVNRFAAIWLNGGTFQVERDNAAIAGTGMNPDANAHFYEVGLNSGGNAFIAVDGVTAGSAASTGAITGDVLRAAIGMRHTGDRPTNGTWARWFACTATPSAGQRTSLLAWSRATYGTP